MLLAGKKILISGVANEKSIAWGIAKSLHKQGAQLIFTYRKEKSHRKLKKLLSDEGIESICIVACDVQFDESIASAFETIKASVGMIDGIIHSVASADLEALQGEFVNTSREQFLNALSISTYSLISFCQHAKSLMTDGGSIITQTYLGSERVIQNDNVMGVAKAALEASVRYLSVDMGKMGIRVNAISPGVIKTSASSAISGIDEKLSATSSRAPLKRNISQEEVGDVSLFLLSSLSRGITGETIFVDAGYHILG
ncbi:Enoyl-[acyl-carrier-protein] reductase [NADH] FabI [compost metagenome]